MPVKIFRASHLNLKHTVRFDRFKDKDSVSPGERAAVSMSLFVVCLVRITFFMLFMYAFRARPCLYLSLPVYFSIGLIFHSMKLNFA